MVVKACRSVLGACLQPQTFKSLKVLFLLTTNNDIHTTALEVVKPEEDRAIPQWWSPAQGMSHRSETQRPQQNTWSALMALCSPIRQGTLPEITALLSQCFFFTPQNTDSQSENMALFLLSDSQWDPIGSATVILPNILSKLIKTSLNRLWFPDLIYVVFNQSTVLKISVFIYINKGTGILGLWFVSQYFLSLFLMIFNFVFIFLFFEKERMHVSQGQGQKGEGGRERVKRREWKRERESFFF